MRLTRPFVLLALGSSAVVIAACVADEPTTPATGDDDSGVQTDGGNTLGDGAGPSADGSSGGDGSPNIDSGPPNFCATQSAPVGSADFFCADFDATDPTTGLSDAATRMSDAATLQPTSMFFKSKPVSMETVIPVTTGGYEVAQHGWVAAGATTLKTLHVSAAINPASRAASMIHPDGLVDLLTIQLPIDSVQIAFAYGTDAPTDDAGSYAGYVIRYARVNTFGFTKTIAVPSLPPETWTNVELTLDLESGTIALAYNGTPTISPITFFAETTTSGTGKFGGATYGDSPGGIYRYDNFTVWTTRAP